MDRIILQLMVLSLLVLPFSGCVDSGGQDTNAVSPENTGMVEVSSSEEIDEALARGPVLVEVGSATCSACVTQKSIMDEIADEYQGEASVMYVDTRDATPVAIRFGDVGYVPDSFVIVAIEDGQYVYMRPDGQTTTDRTSARFVGLTRKETLTAVLDQAVELRQGDTVPAEVQVEDDTAELQDHIIQDGLQESAGMIEVTTFEGLNQTLSGGPVLVEVGSESCSACVAQKPVMEEIATEYQQDASVVYIDNRRGNELAVWFGAGYVPDSFVIVAIEDGQYVYMRPDGQTTTDRTSARFLGPAEKAPLAQTLEKAIEVRQGA